MMDDFKHSAVVPFSRRISGAAVALTLNLCVASVPLLAVWRQLHQIPFSCYLFLVAAFFVADLPRALQTRSAEQLRSYGSYHNWAIAGGLFLLVLQWAVLFEVGHAETRPAFPLMFVGVVITLCGCGLRLSAIVTLGECFVSGPHERAPVTTGIYRLMRHPSESGLLLACAGLTVTFTAWRSAVLIGPLICLFSCLRIREEEAWLKRRHNETYTKYQCRTGRLLPKFRH